MLTNRFKIKNVTGQRANTRARALQKHVDLKVNDAADKYRTARAAYLSLVGPGKWEETLCVLERADVRALNEQAVSDQEYTEHQRICQELGLPADESLFAVESGLGEGHRRLSWIWLAVSSKEDLDDPQMHEGMWHILFCDL